MAQSEIDIKDKPQCIPATFTDRFTYESIGSRARYHFFVLRQHLAQKH